MIYLMLSVRRKLVTDLRKHRYVTFGRRRFGAHHVGAGRFGTVLSGGASFS